MKLFKSSRDGHGFFSGVSVLTLSAVVVKIIGLAYRVPLLGRLGSEGMGYFNTAYEVYALLCVLATAGLPVAMSVLIARAESLSAPGEDRRTVGRIFTVSLWVFVGVGLTGTALMWCLATSLGRLLGNPDAAPCIRAISPTVCLICLSGAFRGYFQGRRNMVPTAVSQIIEALGKLLLGLAFAEYALLRGKPLPEVAAWAVTGLTVGTGCSVVYLCLSYRRALRQCREALPATTPERTDALWSRRTILRRLLATAVPVTVSAGVISLTKCVDLALILRRLQDGGLTSTQANALYGCYSTLAVPVFNLLPTLTSSVALSAVPALSAALTRMRTDTSAAGRTAAADEVRRTSEAALTLTLGLSVPAGVGLCVFGGDILGLLFSGQPEAVAMATPWLRLLGLSVPAACLITVTGAMLQAASHPSCPVVSMLIGTGVKTIVAYLLLGCPSLGLLGAPISSLVCDVLIVAVNLIFLCRCAPQLLPSPWGGVRLVLIPLGLTALCFLPVLLIWRGMDLPAGVIATAGQMAAIGGLYAAASLWLIKNHKVYIT